MSKIYEYSISCGCPFGKEHKFIKKEFDLKETPKRYGDSRSYNNPLCVSSGYVPKDMLAKVIDKNTDGLYLKFSYFCVCYLIEENDELAKALFSSYIHEKIDEINEKLAHYNNFLSEIGQ